jgi:hypothetical protein
LPSCAVFLHEPFYRGLVEVPAQITVAAGRSLQLGVWHEIDGYGNVPVVALQEAQCLVAEALCVHVVGFRVIVCVSRLDGYTAMKKREFTWLENLKHSLSGLLVLLLPFIVVALLLGSLLL